MTQAPASAATNACNHPMAVLLPWHVTNTLDAEDQDAVEAHLSLCADCRGALAEEQMLRAAIVGLPLDSEVAWIRFRETRLDVPPRRTVRRWLRNNVVKRPGRVVAFAAMQAAVILSVVGLTTANPIITDDYRVLSSAASDTPNGNAIVMFRPDTTEAEMRRLLAGAQAKIVGGPTATDSYILQFPKAARANQIAALRREPTVVMIEPIDGPAS